MTTDVMTDNKSETKSTSDNDKRHDWNFRELEHLVPQGTVLEFVCHEKRRRFTVQWWDFRGDCCMYLSNSEDVSDRQDYTATLFGYADSDLKWNARSGHATLFLKNEHEKRWQCWYFDMPAYMDQARTRLAQTNLNQ